MNECCETDPSHSMMVKFGKYWGRSFADPVHMMLHSDEFRESLTDEERECWRREMKDVSMWSLFKEYRQQLKSEKAKAKKAIKESKKAGTAPEEHDYFKGVLHKLKESGMTEESPEGEDNGQE